MRFCLNCGNPLPDAPIVFNLQDSGSQGGQSNPGTNPYGQSMETQFGRPAFQQQQQQQQTPPQNFSMVPPAKKSGGGKKIMVAVGGVVALFFLVLVGGAAIVGYNIWKNKPVVTNSPTPSPGPSSSPSASPSASKSASPTPKPETTKPTPSSSYDNVKVNFKKVWVDYDQTNAGELGMWIHLKFDVTNLKGVDSYAAVYFQKSDDSYLEDGTGENRANDGRVVAQIKLKPGYDTTAYEDLEIFMPYSGLNLTKGKYNLKMDIDLVDNDESLIKHMTYNEFKYEKY
ncbi:MAG: hypothetical protein JSS81_22345 [Acidobacteria bacterium]|nr:hypothetical protein [Acidobacteriota bacterium]